MRKVLIPILLLFAGSACIATAFAASSYTSRANLEKPAKGDQDNTWGTTLNSNLDTIDSTFLLKAGDTITNDLTIGDDLSVTGTMSVTGTAALGDLTTSGTVNMDSGTLFVDKTNNRVGIGNTDPTSSLDITGILSLRGSGNKIIFEGETEDAYEIEIVVDDPDADSTITIPKNITGQVMTITGTAADTDCAQFSLNGDGNYTIESSGGACADTVSDISGPGSSTDNAIVRFDGTAGDQAQNSAVTIDDSGNIVTAGSITAATVTTTGTAQTVLDAGIKVNNDAASCTGTKCDTYLYTQNTNGLFVDASEDAMTVNGTLFAPRNIQIQAVANDTTVTTGTMTAHFTVPGILNGYDVTDVAVGVYDKGITGSTDVKLKRRRSGVASDILSTAVTVGDEWIASDGVIDTGNDDLVTGDQIVVYVNGVHSGTAPNGLNVDVEVKP